MRRSILTAIIVAVQVTCTNGSLITRNEKTGKEFDCLDIGYMNHTFTEPVAIPDNDMAGVIIGPLHMSGCYKQIIGGIILRLEIFHQYTGDLCLSLHYDSDDDSIIDTSSAVEFFLARLDPCDGEELYACFAELEGDPLFFKDEGWEAAGESASFSIFEGMPAGGSFYLSVIDSREGNKGMVREWSIYTEKALNSDL